MKLLSLFSGSGGFELAGAMCGITPIACSEIEPYPIAVTKSRFPNMKHLGDISKINGAEIEPVDIITFGSPCQDMSVAGKRAGLKHEDNGDDETTRSGLFMEAVRIIKEMRGATNGEYPRFAVWENVPGAFSSNKGEDFRLVLEELIKIAEPTAVMPDVPEKGWAYADSYRGDGWSIAYRVFDAQYIRTAQRRRRIYLVLDLGGQCARKILFEREGLRGYFETCGAQRQGTASDVERSIGADDREGTCYSIENHPHDSRVKIDISGKVQTLSNRMGTGGGNVPMVLEPFCKSTRAKSADDATTWKHAEVANTLNTFDLGEVRANELIVQTVALEGNGQRPSHRGDGYAVTDKSYTLNATEVHGVAYKRPIAIDRAFFNRCGMREGKERDVVAVPAKKHYIVRRLTPTECARLQGFPDRWGDIDHKDDFTDEEYKFWLNVRNTHAEINGKAVKDYTKSQMLTWYNKLHTDSAEYKLWGNGIALPCAVYVMQGIEDALKNQK